MHGVAAAAACFLMEGLSQRSFPWYKACSNKHLLMGLYRNTAPWRLACISCPELADCTASAIKAVSQPRPRVRSHGMHVVIHGFTQRIA